MLRRLAASLARRVLPSVEVPRASVPDDDEPTPSPGDVHARIDGWVRADRVVLFMKGTPAAPRCGFSASVAATLARHGVDYRAVDVLADPEVREGVKAYSDWPTLPQLFVDGELVGGADIVEEMDLDGSLRPLLGAPDRPAVQQTPAAQVAAWLAAGEVTLLDVRTDEELALASVPGARQLRREDLPELEQLPRDTRLAFLCHHGMRSQAAAEAFRQIGFIELHNVVGGIEAWSVEVDPEVPRYA